MLNALKNYIKKKFVLGEINRNDRTGALHRAWGHVYTNFLRGDYLEFGLYRGDSFIASYQQYLKFREHILSQLESNEPWRVELAKKFADHEPRFHGLDTFEGMPENKEQSDAFVKGNFLGEFDMVRKRCEAEGIKAPQLKLYKGLFSTTKDELKDEMGERKAAIINIDCDLYESTKDVLEICEPLFQVGTVLLFDDYNAFSADNDKGGRKALREFLKETSVKIDPWFSYQYVGQAFICTGKAT